MRIRYIICDFPHIYNLMLLHLCISSVPNSLSDILDGFYLVMSLLIVFCLLVCCFSTQTSRHLLLRTGSSKEDKVLSLRSPDLHMCIKRGLAFCYKWMPGELKMKGELMSWTCVVQKVWRIPPVLLGCVIKLHLTLESFLQLGSCLSENNMGRSCP